MPRFVFRKWTVLLRVPTKSRHGLVNRHGMAHVGLVCLGAPINTICGKYFVTGSCMSGGPFETLEESVAEAGLDGDREEMDD